MIITMNHTRIKMKVCATMRSAISKLL